MTLLFEHFGIIHPVRNQAAVDNKDAKRVNCWQAVTLGDRNDHVSINHRGGVRHDNDAGCSFTTELRHDSFNFRRAVNRGLDRLYRECRRSGSERIQVIFSKGCGLRIEQDRHARDVWRDFADQFDPFAAQRRLHINEAGDVAAGIWQARHEAAANGIRHGRKDNRDRAGLLLQCRGSWSGYGDKHVRV